VIQTEVDRRIRRPALSNWLKPSGPRRKQKGINDLESACEATLQSHECKQTAAPDYGGGEEEAPAFESFEANSLAERWYHIYHCHY
jgi:hypothetical protein